MPCILLVYVYIYIYIYIQLVACVMKMFLIDSSSTNTIILYQLEDKLIAHDRLMQFFIDTGVLARLTAVTVDGRRLRTVDYLCEHAEKLVAAMTMKQLPNELV